MVEFWRRQEIDWICQAKYVLNLAALDRGLSSEVRVSLVE
jgi:hypothetical protein